MATLNQNWLDKAFSFITGKEGFSATAYPDGQYYSIGYGHNSPDIKPGDKITQEQARSYWESDVQNIVNDISRWSYWDSLTSNQQIALTSFAYNAGTGSFWQLVREGRKPDELAQYWINYYHSYSSANDAGLKQRRQDEINLFNTPDAPGVSVGASSSTSAGGVGNFHIEIPSALDRVKNMLNTGASTASGSLQQIPTNNTILNADEIENLGWMDIATLAMCGAGVALIIFNLFRMKKR